MLHRRFYLSGQVWRAVTTGSAYRHGRSHRSARRPGAPPPRRRSRRPPRPVGRPARPCRSRPTGHTELTRTLSARRSAASIRVSALSAAFEALYAGAPPLDMSASTAPLDTLTIRACSPRAAARPRPFATRRAGLERLAHYIEVGAAARCGCRSGSPRCSRARRAPRLAGQPLHEALDAAWIRDVELPRRHRVRRSRGARRRARRSLQRVSRARRRNPAASCRATSRPIPRFAPVTTPTAFRHGWCACAGPSSNYPA